MSDDIGVLNSGSSSIKFSIFRVDGSDLLPYVAGQIEALFTQPHFIARQNGEVLADKTWSDGVTLSHREATEYLLVFLRTLLKDSRLLAIGHRIAHGGSRFTAPALLNSRTLNELEKLIPLAPLHQPFNLEPIRLGLERRPELPEVGCFDTEFHSTCPEVAQVVALPRRLRNAGVRRYGFHGLSYSYIASQLPSVDPAAAAGKTVVLHLGNGASMCALNACRSVATTMGFSALDGIPMGTRCGSLDPGVILYLLEQEKMQVQHLERLLYKEAGLLGLSGISSDMRTLLQSRDSGAKLAVDVFVYRIGRELGSLAAALGGLDAIVFTGGIGENAAVIRDRICRDAAWLGVELDESANDAREKRISTANSRVSAWVIPTNEELTIARQTQQVLLKRETAISTTA
ncbi:acetate/propionate family kinase [Occallatibacter riparius]|uniref:Acetate kinase n=1 Tax=Occallatibacter riparius TaxID=1002689 RepID=A0A9J7BTW0_9BACT|nr:acetate/propionate family kinase [Occallatibacter riparius]UWZ86071.1 acetate/propionate family kinase [Occallatibacter riparius]